MSRSSIEAIHAKYIDNRLNCFVSSSLKMEIYQDKQNCGQRYLNDFLYFLNRKSSPLSQQSLRQNPGYRDYYNAFARTLYSACNYSNEPQKSAQELVLGFISIVKFLQAQPHYYDAINAMRKNLRHIRRDLLNKKGAVKFSVRMARRTPFLKGKINPLVYSLLNNEKYIFNELYSFQRTFNSLDNGKDDYKDDIRLINSAVKSAEDLFRKLKKVFR